MNKKMKIVIADDNEEITKFMKMNIEQNEKYEVVGVCQNRECQIIDELKPHLVITDLKKNGYWDGLELISRYKNTEYKPKFFVISASALVFHKELIEQGVAYYLNKPYSEEKFLKVLEVIYNEIYPRKMTISNSQIIKYSKFNYIINFIKRIKNI